MADITEKASRELTMKDFFREENGEIVPIDESVLIDFQDGDIVEGEVVRIDKDEVLVDIGYKSEGLIPSRSEEHTSELQSRQYLVCRLLLEKKKRIQVHKNRK